MIVCQFIKITAFFLCGVMFMALMFEVWKQVRTITKKHYDPSEKIYCNYFATYSAFKSVFPFSF